METREEAELLFVCGRGGFEGGDSGGCVEDEEPAFSGEVGEVNFEIKIKCDLHYGVHVNG